MLKYTFSILKPLGYYLDKLLTNSSVVTVTSSKAHMSFLKEISNKQVEIVNPGCYLSTSIPQKRGDFILALTKWDIGKNPKFLLRVLKKLPKKVKLVVAGNWIQKSVYEEFTSKVMEENLTNQVEVVGYADKETQKKLYSEARVLIHPIFEAFGMFGLEAASFGCPIIIPKGSGVTDLFTHGIQGFFPEEGDEDAYAKYLNMLISDERLAWKMGYEAWKIAKKNTWADHSQRLIEIFESAKSE